MSTHPIQTVLKAIVYITGGLFSLVFIDAQIDQYHRGIQARYSYEREQRRRLKKEMQEYTDKAIQEQHQKLLDSLPTTK
jgi:hypothetical protein